MLSTCEQKKHETITRQMVTKSFELYKSQCNKMDEAQIIDILGGIDFIFNECLSENNHTHMTKNQLCRLHQLFITPPRNGNEEGMNQIANMVGDESILHNHDMHIFDVTDTYLYTILAEERAANLSNRFHSVWPHLFAVCGLSIVIILRVTVGDPLIFLLILILVWPAMLFYVTMWLLCINKKAILLIMHTFEFWLKLICTVIATTLNTIHPPIDTTKYPVLYKCILIGWTFNFIGVVISVAMFDGLNIARRYKIILSGAFSISLAISVIYLEYDLSFKRSDFTIDFTNNITLSLLSIQQSALQMVAVFCCKQTILTVFTCDARSILIKHRAYIEWNVTQTGLVAVANLSTYALKAALSSPTPISNPTDDQLTVDTPQNENVFDIVCIDPTNQNIPTTSNVKRNPPPEYSSRSDLSAHSPSTESYDPSMSKSYSF
eukprot:723289_1